VVELLGEAERGEVAAERSPLGWAEQVEVVAPAFVHGLDDVEVAEAKAVDELDGGDPPTVVG
jgi:hypothetical protein